MLFGAFAPIAVFMPTVTTMAANGEGGLLPLGVFTGSTMLAMSFCEPTTLINCQLGIHGAVLKGSESGSLLSRCLF